MKKISLKSPAKINLSLDIIKKLPNGYHQIKTIVQTVNIFDEIEISETHYNKFIFIKKGLKIPNLANNIIYRSVEEFFKVIKTPIRALEIKIIKKIPIQAGLGGGSSNAAITLLGLNHLLNYPLSKEKLIKIGQKLGADVPLFFKGGTCLCEGIGEKLTPMNYLNNVYFVIIKPEFGFKTKVVYQNFDETKVKKKPDFKKIISAISDHDIKTLSKNIYNVLETSISSHEIFKIKGELISRGALTSSMSGSGSSVFGLFDNLELAKKTIKDLKKKYPQIFLALPIKSYFNLSLMNLN